MLFFTLVMACSDVKDEHGHDHDHELMTTVVLDFASTDGSEAFTATWADPEQSGSPTIDDVTLTDGQTYVISVSFLNELEDPAEDITPEIDDEADEHQVFFTGSAIDSLVTHSYLDSDSSGLPLGLENEFSTIAAGTDSFKLTLRHMPPEDGQAIKVAGLEDTAESEGVSALPGASDIEVDFPLTVQ